MNHSSSQPATDFCSSLLEPLAAHDRLLQRFREIHLDRVRYLAPLAPGCRADAIPRARRRTAELPTVAILEEWYRVLKAALTAQPDDRISRELVLLMMSTMKGRPTGPLIVDTFVYALGEARVSPQLVAGAVKRTWTQRSMAPALQAFRKIVDGHRAETKTALELVTRTMGLRRDAEKMLS